MLRIINKIWTNLYLQRCSLRCFLLFLLHRAENFFPLCGIDYHAPLNYFCGRVTENTCLPNFANQFSEIFLRDSRLCLSLVWYVFFTVSGQHPSWHLGAQIHLHHTQGRGHRLFSIFTLRCSTIVLYSLLSALS